MRFDDLNRNNKIFSSGGGNYPHCPILPPRKKKKLKGIHVFCTKSLKRLGIRENIMLILQRARVEPEAWKMSINKYPKKSDINSNFTLSTHSPVPGTLLKDTFCNKLLLRKVEVIDHTHTQ